MPLDLKPLAYGLLNIFSASVRVITACMSPCMQCLGPALDAVDMHGTISILQPKAVVSARAGRCVCKQGQSSDILMACQFRLHAVKQLYIALHTALLNDATDLSLILQAVFQTFNFRFTYCLTLIHTLTTIVGLWLFAGLGLFQRKPIPLPKKAPLAAAFAAYIAFGNLNLRVNTVGFYQVNTEQQS